MTLDELQGLFSKHENEYLKFDRISAPRSGRADLCAFLMLDAIMPGFDDVISAAEHDVIYLCFGLEGLAAVVTDDIVRDLVRCGVFLDRENESLSMFA